MNQEKYQPKTNYAFQRWLNKWYPDENHIRDRYKELWREYCPRKQIIVMLTIMLGMLPIAVVCSFLPNEGLWLLVQILVFLALIAGVFLGIFYVPWWMDQRSAKPTPKKD